MRNRQSTQASALFVTLLTVGLIAFLLLRAATTVHARIDVHNLTQAQQQAVYSAESAAALKEVELVSIAATNDLQLLANMGTRSLGPGADLNGDGDFDDPGEQRMVWDGDDIWFANCRVRWRIEPIAVTNGSEFTVNPAPNPSVLAPPATDVDGGGPEDYATNYDFYNFRIATEAYYLTDPNDATATPWDDPEDRVAIAQATRVVQLRLNTLFKYALFYAASGPEGDIEFHNGPELSVAGAVHSNGAIYFGGDKNQGSYSGGSTIDPGDNGPVTIGENADGKRVSTVAVNGLFRSQKYPMYWAFRHGYIASLDPWHLPLHGTDVSVFDSSIVSSETMTGSKNANAGTGGGYTINGEPMYRDSNDSRNQAGMEATWGALVRDSRRGATVVRTLANIPDLGGRPFEPQRAVQVQPEPDLTPLWVRDPINGDFTLTILPNDPPGGFYYDPFGDRDADPDNDYDFVSDPPDAAHLATVSRVATQYQVAGTYGDPTSGRARQLYYDTNPALIADTAKTDIEPSGYDTGETASGGTIPGLPRYITTNNPFPPADEFVVDAGGMPYFFQQDLGGLPLFRPSGGTALVDVTDPLANAFDSARSWYVDPDGLSADDAYAKWIYSGPAPGITDTTNLLRDRDGSGNEQDGWRVNCADGVYYRFSLYDGNNNDPGPGLTIRERPQQATWFMDPAPAAGFGIPQSGDYADQAVFLQDYANYLKSQYIVYFGYHFSSSGEIVQRDITDLFFEHGLATATDTDDLIATEDWVRNRRETGFMGWRFGKGDLANFRVNWLTLNTAQVGDFIRTTTLGQIQPAADSDTLSTVFNGMLYVARTRRSDADTTAPSGTDDFTGHYERNSAGDALLPHGPHPIWNPDWRRPLDPLGQRLDFTWNSSDYVAPDHGYPATPDATQRALMAQVRCGNGPDCTFQSAVRMRNGELIDWGGLYVPPGGGPPTRTRGITVVSPNPVFLWGDYNVTMTNTSGGTEDYRALANHTGGSPSWAGGNADQIVSEEEYEARSAGYELPPCAVFTDSLNVLSNDWTDSAQAWNNSPTAASETFYQVSTVTNNVPTYLIDGGTNVLPSGGPHNLIRFLEDWGGGKFFHIKGSVVVMGRTKYTLAEAGWSGSSRTSNYKYYSPPKRDIQFNTDLFTRPGQPPFTPFGVQVIRTVQTVNIKDL